MVMQNKRKRKLSMLVLGAVALIGFTVTVYQIALLRVKFTEQIEIFRLEKARKKDDETDEPIANFKSGSEG